MEKGAGRRIRTWAPAKINLNLLVVARRGDGYHELDSYVAKVSLYDEIELYARQDGHLHLLCTGADCGDPEENLALCAARSLRTHCLSQVPVSAAGTECPGVDIEVRKHIPPGKGLGGGSSDAAAVLAGLRELWRLGTNDEELTAMAAELGSDVPLFLGPPAARMTGRGEKLQPVAVHPFVAGIFMTDFFCSTAEVYQACDESPSSPSEQLDATLLATQPPSKWRHLLVNHLFEPAMTVCPPLAELCCEFRAALPCPLHMTGSGSALFILCDDADELADVTAKLPDSLRSSLVAVTNNPF